MRRIVSLLSILLVTSACADANADAAPEAGAALAQVAAPAADLPTVLVYKTPTCGCCNGWIEHMQAAGFTVDARDVSDIMTVKHDSGVPVSMSSCHTSIIDGYVVEGHVPAEQVMRLLAERPEIAGIAVPGMPTGSPGMEGRNAKPYEVLSFTHTGERAVFAEIDPR
jgi:hypothetical protein